MILKCIQSGIQPMLLIHGGAGAIRADILSEEMRIGRLEGLRAALKAGWTVLSSGGTALDAAQSSVAILEDHPLYNAGIGSVLNEQGTVEMDASIMDGVTRRAGALCGSRQLRNPIKAARRLLEAGRVFVVAGEAEDWLAAQGESLVENETFHTAARLAQYKAALGTGRALLDHEAEAGLELEKGTVGAVARDANGHLAAATSTGGMSNKHAGRIGDSPVIGAGTWADDRSVALSATGDGEAILRCALAHEVEARVRLLGSDLGQAGEAGLRELGRLGGEGGFVVVDHGGAGLLAANSEGMYRGWIDPEAGRYGLAIFQEDMMVEGPLDEL